MAENLTSLISEIKEDETLSEVRRALESGEEPLQIMEELRKGIAVVGERFQAKEYYLSEMMMSAEIFVQSIALLEPYLEASDLAQKGSVIIGTVQGDIHDIGKNIVATLLRCDGYDVRDLGVDVAPETFVSEVKETGSGLVALCALLTPAFDSMRETVEALVEAGLRDRLKVIIGGGPVNQAVVDYTGADGYGEDATQAVVFAHRFIGE